MIMKLHPDWPDFDLTEERWGLPQPVSDLAYALDLSPVMTAETTPRPTEPILLQDISRVDRYDISYHGSPWVRDDDVSGGSELSMTLLAELSDGRWLSVEAWNDYTGWGCQDGSELRVGDTRERVISQGLTAAARKSLGL
jgi:hypothetical protein